MRIQIAIALTLLICAAGMTLPDPIVIAGSDDPPASPPSFWDSSFWGITSSIDRAFPFTLVADRPSRLEELDVAAYHYENSGGTNADFSIALDDGGLPGTDVAVFHVNGITTTPQILSATLAEDVTLEPDVQYWIVGRTAAGQVNWNLGDSTFGPAAYLVHGEDWVYYQNTNVSAFTLRGTPVPEPGGIATGCALCALAAWRRSRSTRRSAL
jgi:hypothetical protein